MANQKYQKFQLEKILTISASEYCQMIGARLTDYYPIGVHDDSFYYWGNPTEHFSEFVPAEAEVVVNYQINRSLGEYAEAEPGRGARGVQFTCHGTALIRKNKEEKIKCE